MKQLIQILKGCAIGISDAIPGFSGGTMAILLNAYDDFVTAMGNIFLHPFKTLARYWGLFLGIMLGFIISVFTIVELLKVVPIPTMLFFTGLVIGSVPSHFLDIKKEKKGFSWKNILVFLLSVALIVGLALAPTNEISIESVNVGLVLILLVMGMFCSASMILPGISGSMLLMVFGYYSYIMGEVKYLLTFAFGGDYVTAIIIVCVFGIGAVLGLTLMSRLMSFLLKKFPLQVNYAILGLLCASPFAILWKAVGEYGVAGMGVGGWVGGILALLVGIALALLFAWYGKKKSSKVPTV